MPQVNIPGVGKVNFPDTMSPDQITQEAAKLHLQAQAPKPSAKPSVSPVDASTAQSATQPPSPDEFRTFGPEVPDKTYAPGIAGEYEALTEALKGAGKGALSTIGNLIDMGSLGPVGYAVKQATQQRPAIVTPSNPEQNLGFKAEQIGEFFLPGGMPLRGAKAAEAGILAATKAPRLAKILGLGARMGLEAGAAGGVSAAQGNDPTEAAVLSAAIPGAGAAIKGAAGLTKMSPRLVNSLIKPVSKMFDFGRDPGAGVVREGIVANTKEGLLEKISKVKSGLGKMIEARLVNLEAAAGKELQNAPKGVEDVTQFGKGQPGKGAGMAPRVQVGAGKIAASPAAMPPINTQAAGARLAEQQRAFGSTVPGRIFGEKRAMPYQPELIGRNPFTPPQITPALPTAPKTIDVSKALGPIDDAISGAVKRGEQELVNRLTSLREGLTKEFKLVDGKVTAVGERNLLMTPKSAAKLKTEIGETTRWTGQAFDSDLNQVRVAVYRNLNDAIDEAVPGIKKLNARYADILSAEKALDRTLTVEKRKNMIGLPDVIAGTGLLGGLLGSGHDPIQSVVAGVMATLGSKAMGSTAAKTRIASLLGTLEPGAQKKVIELIPALKNIYLGMKSGNEDGKRKLQEAQKKTTGLRYLDSDIDRFNEAGRQTRGAMGEQFRESRDMVDPLQIGLGPMSGPGNLKAALGVLGMATSPLAGAGRLAENVGRTAIQIAGQNPASPVAQFVQSGPQQSVANLNSLQTLLSSEPRPTTGNKTVDSGVDLLSGLIPVEGVPMLAGTLGKVGREAKAAGKAAEAVSAAGKGRQYYRSYHNPTGSGEVPWMLFTANQDEVESGYGAYRFVASDAEGKVVDASDLEDDIREAFVNAGVPEDWQRDIEDLISETNPGHIVDSAGVWDSPDLVQLIWDKVLEPKGIQAVRTDDGLVVFDPELVKSLGKRGKR